MKRGIVLALLALVACGDDWADDDGKTHTVSVPQSTYDTCRDGQRLNTSTLECRST